MKKWVIYLLSLTTIPILSFGGLGGADVGDLHPVQVVMVREEKDQLDLMTDTEDAGSRVDAHQAIQQMKDYASGKVFLDTADYVLLEAGSEIWLSQLSEYLRPSCSLCYAAGDVDLVEAGAYLKLHEPRLTLTQYQAGERHMPYLISEKGRLKLVQP